MSRSRKKSCVVCVNHTSRGAMKKWKVMCNRKIRRSLLTEDSPVYKKISDIWNSPSDGKYRSNDPKAYRK